MLELINQFLDLILTDKKKQISTRVAPDMYEAILKKAKAEHLDPSEYIRAVLAVDAMPEIIEKELRRETNQKVLQDSEDALKLYFTDKLGKFKLLKRLTEFAVDRTYGICKAFVKMEFDCLNEIGAEISKELGDLPDR